MWQFWLTFSFSHFSLFYFWLTQLFPNSPQLFLTLCFLTFLERSELYKSWLYQHEHVLLYRALSNRRFGEHQGRVFAPFLFQLKNIIVKCSWTSALKSPRRTCKFLFQNSIPAWPRNPEVCPITAGFVASEQDLPLAVLKVPAVSKSIWKCQGK